MSTSRRSRGLDDEIYARRRRKRKRIERKHTRRRAFILALAAVVALLFVVAGAAVTTVATFGSSCDLNSLQQVEIGSNTFIYAADNSRLGVIPAERNRQPVPYKRISSWMPKSTVAIEDRRFYQHDGVDVEGIARALWKNVSAGQVVEGGSTITQQLVRNLYIGREQTVERKLKEACLAIKLDKAWVKNRILATYMNQVYYGNLAYGIEAAAQTYFSKNASELNLPESAMLAGLPQAPSDYNPFQKEEVAKGRRNQVLLRDADRGRDHPGAVRLGGQARARAQGRQALQGDPRARLLRLRPRPADRRVRRRHRPLGRAQGLHDDRSPLPAGGAEGDQGDALRVRRSGRRRDLDQPEERRHPRDDGRDPGQQEESVQPALAGAAPVRLDVQDVRARGRGRAGDQPRDDDVPLGAVLLPARPERELRRRQLVVPGDVRPQLHRLDDDRTGHAPFGQHGLRAADAGRDPRGGRQDGDEARRPLAALRRRRLRPVDRPRRDGRLAARHGLRVRDARRRRHLLRADGDPQGDPPDGVDTKQAGGSRSASA